MANAITLSKLDTVSLQGPSSNSEGRQTGEKKLPEDHTFRETEENLILMRI